MPLSANAPATATFPHDAHCRVFVGDGSTGSGTLISRNDATGLVLTCSHLFDDTSADVVAAFPDGSRYGARLVERDPANDLAALLIKRPDAEPIAVDDSDPTGVLSACGYGSDGRFRPAIGTISGAVQAIGASFPSVKITGAVRPGDSGGGVMDAAAKLVGVVWGCRDGETYFTCGRPLREFLDRVWPGRKNRRSKTDDREPSPDSPAVTSPPSSAPTPDLTARIEKVESDVAALHSSKQDRGEYLQVGDLNGYAKHTELPSIDASKFATHDEVASVESAAKGLVESLHSKLREQLDEKLTQILPAVTQQIATTNPGLFAGLSYGKLLAGTLGVSGPLGLALVVAGGLLGRRIKSRESSAHGGEPSRAPGSQPSTADFSRPIAVDTPPPPQRTVPETHYVPVERDDFARAHQWASENVARKYPGATEVLTTLDSLIKQQLAAQDSTKK
jgi:Trypsin-like peptidase domain